MDSLITSITTIRTELLRLFPDVARVDIGFGQNYLHFTFNWSRREWHHQIAWALVENYESIFRDELQRMIKTFTEYRHQ